MVGVESYFREVSHGFSSLLPGHAAHSCSVCCPPALPVLFSRAAHQAGQSPGVTARWDNSIPGSGLDVYLC